MLIRITLALLLGRILLVCPGLSVADESNMIGRQSQNEGMLIVPAPGDVTIDGRLDDWEWSGRIWVFADKDLRSQYSVEATGMWDDRYLYLAARWRDPTPMVNTVNPDFSPEEGWKSDAWQMRIQTDRPLWITTWYYTPERQPVMHIAYWKDPRNSRAGQDVTLLVAEPGGTTLGQNVEMAYRKDGDGGFVQEMRIPWKLLYQDVPTPHAGLTLRMGSEFLWGDPSGKTWPVHRYADNMQPGHTSREFFWTATNAWGDARLVGEQTVPLRRYVYQAGRLQGRMPIRLRLPKDAARFSLVIEDDAGRRVRQMGGLDPADYMVQDRGDTITVEVSWDGLTDKVWTGNHSDGYRGAGQLVSPGTYRVRGLYHEGLNAYYENTFYNPGTPPWRTGDTTGAWLSNHALPQHVAAAGPWMIVACSMSEGGSALIGIRPDGLKGWGELRGAQVLAADEQFVYTVPGHHEPLSLNRFSATTGKYRPFDGREQLDLPLSEIFGDEMPGQPIDLIVTGDTLVMSMSDGVLALLDAAMGKLEKQFTLPGTTALGAGNVDGNPTVFAVLSGQVHRLDLLTGRAAPVATPGVVEASALTVDHEGNLLVADTGPDSQIKAFSDGKPLYACGRKGGRPLRGRFDRQAMVKMSSVAVDRQDQVWVTENWNYPRRVSVWNRDGMLVRDYIGNTGYAGTGCYLHDEDPTLGYVGPIEVRLDHKDRTWNVTKVLWVPDRQKGECFGISPQSHVQPQRFRSDASGRMREYLYAHDARDGGGHVIYVELPSGAWQPVAAICLVHHISGRVNRQGDVEEPPSGDFADLNAYDGVFWHDDNGDAIPQRKECEIMSAAQPTGRQQRSQSPLSLSNGWGGRIDPDTFQIYADGITVYQPSGFDADGGPIYRRSGVRELGVDDRGDLVPVPGEDQLICLSWKGYAGPTRLAGIDTKREAVMWEYPNPYPGVHGSHRAPMPEPGLLIGPLKTMGTVHLNDEVGSVFALRGNLGQDFFMTTDGVFVGALFRDGRLPVEPLPAKETQLIGQPMQSYSEGGEPFSGWFGRHDDGVIRMTTSMARTACMVVRVTGLETIERFQLDPITLDAATLVEMDRDNIARAAAAEAESEKAYNIAKLDLTPTIDGAAKEWKKVPGITIARPGTTEQATVKLAYDIDNLYAVFEVSDASPWKNTGKDFRQLFKTGDAVDLQLGVDPSLPRQGNRVNAPDLRLLLAPFGQSSVAVLMKPFDPTAAESMGADYHSPVGDKHFDRVAILNEVTIKVQVDSDRYTVEAAVPLQVLGLRIKPGQTIRGDLGFISSDAAGSVNVARTYWANPHTNLVNDLPLEACLTPDKWGKLTFE